VPPTVLASLKASIFREVRQAQGFMNLLMKPRNGMPWTTEDRSALHMHLRRLAQTLPILGLFSLPGGSVLLPLLALFLDRRKERNRKAFPVSPVQSREDGTPASNLNHTEAQQ
jgi:hypothetical protein